MVSSLLDEIEKSPTGAFNINNYIEHSSTSIGHRTLNFSFEQFCM